MSTCKEGSGGASAAFLERVASTVAAHQMIVPGQNVLLALSGGPDSTALLHALWQLKRRLRCRLCACHVHHGLRGAEADADADHAAAQAASHQVPFLVKEADVRSHARRKKLSLETAAREVRYELLEEAARVMGASRIATGHSADDRAETVLLNLLRGAGPGGLSGIPPVRGKIVRPLLDVSRAEVEDYCRAEKLSYRIDQSNLDKRFMRNRVRHEIMPVLRQVQPSVVAALGRLAEIMRGENEWATFMAAEALEEIASEWDGGVAISLRRLSMFPLALQRRVLRLALAKVKGDGKDLELERVDALVALTEHGRTGAVIELPGGLRVERGYDKLVIAPTRAPSVAPKGQWKLPVPGQTFIAELGVTFRVSRSRDLSIPDDPNQAALDAEETGNELVVRTWRPGDRFAPLGMSGWVKLQDFFVDAKVPRSLRPWIPLVVSRRFDHIVWVKGYRINDRYKVTEETRRTIRIQAEWVSPRMGGP